MVVNTKSKTALQKEAGAQQSTKTHEDIRESLLSFRMDNISSGLGTKQVWDEIKGEYGLAEPQFYFRVGDNYPNIAKNSETLIAVGKYLIQVGELIEGVSFGKTNEYTPAEIQNAKAKLDQFRKGSS